LPSIDIHSEPHPLNAFSYRKHSERVTGADIPAGKYLRPEQHLAWLENHSKAHQVWLQSDPPPGWTNARRFPREEILKEFEDLVFPDPSWRVPYIASGPAWILLLALRDHCTDLYITGIHLATQREYVDQRPNFEYLLAYAKGRGVRVHLPAGTPLCKGTHEYCYQKRRTQEMDALQFKIDEVRQKKATLIPALKTKKVWTRPAIDRQLHNLRLEEHNLRWQLQRVAFAEHLQRPEWRVS